MVITFKIYSLSNFQVYNKMLIIVTVHVTQSYLTLKDPMDYSTPGFSVSHQLLKSKFMSIASVKLK